MLSQRAANIGFVILVLAACGYFAWIAEGFTAAGLLASSGLPSKFFPQLALGFMALCAVIIGALYLLKGEAGGDEAATVFESGGDARRSLLMVAVAIICYLIWREFGFIVMAVVMAPLSLLAMGVRNPWIYLTVWILTGLIYLTFTRALGVVLP